VRVQALVLAFAAVCCTTPAANAGSPLRHVAYAVTSEVDGHASTAQLGLDLVATGGDRAVTLELSEPDAAEPIRVDVDKEGGATVAGHVSLSREAALLVYFFALSAQNMTGLGPGDEWGADGDTGDGTRHKTRFRVVRTPAEGRLDIAFTRTLALAGERADYHGKLLYDAFKVVPLGFSAEGEFRATEDGVARTHAVRLSLTLTGDSQP
jgi:hypothetical protein